MQIETILRVGLKFQLRRSRLFLERNNRHKIKKKSRLRKRKEEERWNRAWAETIWC